MRTQPKPVGEKRNSEFKAHISATVDPLFQLRQKIRRLNARVARDTYRLALLRRELCAEINKVARCPKCGTIGEHYCPTDVARGDSE